jgi:MFS family permease
MPEAAGTPGGGAHGARPGISATLVALIAGQLCLHACMSGVRMAAPLQVLRMHHAEWTVGVLMGLFALAPIALALPAGRLADRRGYHRPMRIAVALTLAGGLLALLSTWMGRWAVHGDFAVLCLAATFTGSGANVGLIAIQRTAGRSAHDAAQRRRVFGWLGLAPALSNAIGPVLAGALIDLGGFRLAFTALMLLPLAALWWMRRVPAETPPAVPHAAARRSSWDLLRSPGLRRLLLVNWVLSAGWDVHSFVIPILGHERGLSASAIGAVLGVFAVSVALVRIVIPVLAHRAREATVLGTAMLSSAAIFAVYPLMRSPWTMGACAALLGFALGSVQPMIMASLHHITPHERHGEAIALRSMTLNLSSATMPLLFGLAGSAVGAGALFWVMGAAVAAGSWTARHVRAEGDETRPAPR